jgi:hypothetical protein
VELLMLALQDKYHGLRSYAASKLDLRKEGVKAYAEPLLYKLAQSDPKRTVKAAAIEKLGEYGQAKYATLFRTALNDSSYTVAGNALEALALIDSAAAYKEAQRLMTEKTKGTLSAAVSKTMIQFGDESAADVILSNFENMPLSQAKLEALQPVIDFLGKIKSLEPLNVVWMPSNNFKQPYPKRTAARSPLSLVACCATCRRAKPLPDKTTRPHTSKASSARETKKISKFFQKSILKTASLIERAVFLC